jgi:ABC-2 type transport system permease protein
MTVGPYAAATAAIVRRDAQVYFSYRARVFTQLGSMLFSVALFYYLSRLLRVSTFASPDAYFAFAVVGIAVVSVIQSTLALPTTLRGELMAGTFERMLLSPFGAVRSALAMMLFPMLNALVVSTLTIASAALIFGLDVHLSTVALAPPAAVLAALSFSALAIAVAAVVVVFKQAPGMGLVIAGITLISGFYFPTDLLPGWIRWTSDVQPFTPAVNLLRDLVVGLPTPESPWVYAAKLWLFTLALTPLAAVLLGKALELGQRRGTIIEY